MAWKPPETAPVGQRFDYLCDDGVIRFGTILDPLMVGWGKIMNEARIAELEAQIVILEASVAVHRDTSLAWRKRAEAAEAKLAVPASLTPREKADAAIGRIVRISSW